MPRRRAAPSNQARLPLTETVAATTAAVEKVIVAYGIPRAFERQRLILHCGLQINSSEALKRAAMNLRAISRRPLNRQNETSVRSICPPHAYLEISTQSERTTRRRGGDVISMNET